MENQLNQYIEKLKTLLQDEDLKASNRAINDLKTGFEDELLKAENKIQVAQLKAQENGETFETDIDFSKFKNDFYEIYIPFKQAYKLKVEEEKKLKQENLSLKKKLIAQLEELVNSTEPIGALFAAQKEINEKWKTTGNVPRELGMEVQQSYSRALDEFHYQMSIRKELKNYDAKKNAQLKQAVISKLKSLNQLSETSQIERGIKSLQEEWENIGPTNPEDWEELKNNYWEEIKTAYEKIKIYYENKRQRLQKVIEEKQKLVVKAKEVLDSERTSTTDWNRDTDILIKIQEVWKSLGFGTRKQNEEVWQELRTTCDEFFEKKSDFYKSIQKVYDEIAAQKSKLIDEVELLKDSENWKETTAKIIQLQKKWKSLGNAGQKHEQKLWKRFRAACDHFFDAKSNYFDGLDKANETNYQEKLALIAEIKSCDLPENKDEAIAMLNKYAEDFNKIGHVPREKKDEIFEAFKTVIDEHYKSLNLEGEEKEKVMFKAKINTLKANPNSDKLLDKERQFIKSKIEEINQNILQYENNLGFLSSNGKGKNPFVLQVEENIQKEKEQKTIWLAKLKLLANE